MVKSVVSGVFNVCPRLPFVSHLRYFDHMLWDIRLWECHLHWGGNRFGFGL